MWNYVYWVQVMIGISLVPHGSGSKVFRCRDAQSLTTAGPMISEIPFGAWIGARRLETAVVFTAALKGWNNWPSAHSLGRICWLEGLEVVSKLCQGQTLPSNLQDLRNLANTKRIWSTVAQFGKDQLNVGREMAPREVLPAKEEAWSSARKGRWKEDERKMKVPRMWNMWNMRNMWNMWNMWNSFEDYGSISRSKEVARFIILMSSRCHWDSWQISHGVWRTYIPGTSIVEGNRQVSMCNVAAPGVCSTRPGHFLEALTNIELKRHVKRVRFVSAR